jgi:hypothetical protein
LFLPQQSIATALMLTAGNGQTMMRVKTHIMIDQ